MKGSVKWFDSRRGYGFITTEEGNEIFVHFSAIVAQENEFKVLYEGDAVEFEVVEGDKGPQANTVNVLERAPRKRRSRGGNEK